jgi:hypothetical protein
MKKATNSTPRRSAVAALERAASKGKIPQAVKIIQRMQTAQATAPRGRKRPAKTDRLRGDEKPKGANIIELMRTEEGRSKLRALSEENARRWTILGTADDAENRLVQIASALRLEWDGDHRFNATKTPAQRDLHEAAFRLHCLRESHKRGDLENAACHLYALGQYVERLRVRVMEGLPRLGKGQKQGVIFQILDDAKGELTRRNERGVTFSSNAVWYYAIGAQKMKQKTKDNWFTEWRKARGL